MNTPFYQINWREMTRSELDDGLNNVAAVSSCAELVAEWDRRSSELRAQHSEHLDLRYGELERKRIDLLIAAERAPTVLFIHGGYWQTRAKESFTVFAEGLLAHKINVALTGYTLAPDATMDEIVSEIHKAVDFLVNHLPTLGADPHQIFVCGWSTGGHLTSMTLSHPHVRAGLSISGLFDLEPIRHSYLNTKLKLDAVTSRRNSPILRTDDSDKPLSLVVGGDELPLLREQTASYAAHRARIGLPVNYEEIARANHFTIMNELASPTGRITTLIRQLIHQVASQESA